MGIDVFAKQTLASSYVSYDSQQIGTNLVLGFALTEEMSFSPHYTIYRQEIKLPDILNNCILSKNALINGGSGVTPGDNCYSDGEASLPVRMELAQGPVTVSIVGYALTYNTLDSNKSPTSGFYAEFKQDFAGVGGDVNFIKSMIDTRTYFEVIPDVIGVLHVQGGNMSGWGGKNLRMLDHFQMGPNLVRGFQPSGIGPRDITPGTTNDALGGTMYWGASLEAQTPLYFLPKEIGIKMAAFADSGSVWKYQGPTSWNVTGERLQVGLDDPMMIRSSVGVGLLWDSPLGPLRFDLAYPVTKYCATPTGNGAAPVCDRKQIFRFSGGTRF